MKVGVRDIAREAGVAVSTVSHVLNGTASISREVRERVLGVARNLGYLDQRRAKATIATIERIVLALPQNVHAVRDTDLRHRAAYEGLRRECERRSLKVSLAVSATETIDIALARDIYEAENASGIMVVGNGDTLDLGELALSGIPLVVINGEEKHRRADAVVPADAFAADIAVRHLEECEHERILLLSANGCGSLGRRLAGFSAAMETTSLEAVAPVVAEADSAEAGEAALADRLAGDRRLDGATAIFCLSDQLAEGALRALASAGLRVPADLSLIGCDGTLRSSPPLTTVSVFYERLGTTALALMESRLLVPRTYRSFIRVEIGSDLIAGATVGPPPGKADARKAMSRLRDRKVHHGGTGRGGPHARPLSGRSR